MYRNKCNKLLLAILNDKNEKLYTDLSILKLYLLCCDLILLHYFFVVYFWKVFEIGFILFDVLCHSEKYLIV